MLNPFIEQTQCRVKRGETRAIVAGSSVIQQIFWGPGSSRGGKHGGARSNIERL